MNEYNALTIAYEPALEKMRELWPNEDDWKPLFDKLIQLEPDEDPSAVLGEIDHAMALCAASANTPIDYNVESMSKDDFNAIQAQLTALSNAELLSMLTTRSIPKNIESILMCGSKHDPQDSDSGDDNEYSMEIESNALQLEQDLLSKLLGVTTGLDDGIFLVRCMVRIYLSLLFLYH